MIHMMNNRYYLNPKLETLFFLFLIFFFISITAIIIQLSRTRNENPFISKFRGFFNVLILPSSLSLKKMLKFFFKLIIQTAHHDDRSIQGNITSRIGLTTEANTFDANLNIYEFILSQVKLESSEPIKCILLDEAQFLTKSQVKELCQIVDELGIPVLTYGLRTDFRGEPFGKGEKNPFFDTFDAYH